MDVYRKESNKKGLKEYRKRKRKEIEVCRKERNKKIIRRIQKKKKERIKDWNCAKKIGKREAKKGNKKIKEMGKVFGECSGGNERHPLQAVDTWNKGRGKRGREEGDTGKHFGEYKHLIYYNNRYIHMYMSDVCRYILYTQTHIYVCMYMRLSPSLSIYISYYLCILCVCVFILHCSFRSCS